MGARNFGSNDYLSLTYLVDVYELANNPGFIEDCKDREVWEEGYEPTEDDIWDEAADTANFWTEEAYEDAEYLLDKHRFNYITLQLEPGYYEGIQLFIEPDFPSYIESEEDREDIFNEISELGELLSEFMDRGWDGDFEDLSDLIHQLMEEAQDIPIDDYDEPGYDLE